MGFNRRGEPDGWVTAGDDAPVWDEDSIEVFLGDAREQQMVLERFDVAREAGGVRNALVQEFRNIPASGTIRIEMVPADSSPSADTAPILSAIELQEEGFEVAGE